MKQEQPDERTIYDGFRASAQAPMPKKSTHAVIVRRNSVEGRL
jgi:hypothetical protein